MPEIESIVGPVLRLTSESRRQYLLSGALARPAHLPGAHPCLPALDYPIVATDFAGSRMIDVDGNSYLDFSMAFGSALFGHGPGFLRRSLAHQCRRGMGVGPASALATSVAEKISAMTGMPRVALACSGTEAVMVALRLARAATLRPGVVLFRGAYHGQYDGVLARPPHPFEDDLAQPIAAGVSRGACAETMVLDFGSEQGLEAIATHADRVAAVLVEPMAASDPVAPPAGYLARLRALTAAHGIALIFDEMLTGFRLARGGAQEYFGLRADLAIYGKVMSAGMPLAAIAGRERFLDTIDGAPLSARDSVLTTFTASSFAHHPLSLAAASAVLERLDRAGGALQVRLARRTARLVQAVNTDMARLGVPLRWLACGSHFVPAAPARPDSLALRLLHHALLLEGVYLAGCGGFLATTHVPRERDALRHALTTAVRRLLAAGCVPGEPDPHSA